MSLAQTDDSGLAQMVDDVRRYVRRRVDDPVAQEDLVQEVFLRMHDRCSSVG